MSKNRDDDLSKTESFQNAIFYFFQSVEIGTKGAEAQCEYFGDHNVAWELRDELLSAKYLVCDFAYKFTNEELVELKALVNLLESMPTSLLSEATNRRNNQSLLENSLWDAVRAQCSTIHNIIIKKWSESQG